MSKLETYSIDKNASNDSEPSILIGLSACLAGQEVRYNGGHTQSRLCLDVLSKHFTYKTFCPEVAAGFGTPRPTMRLTGNPDTPKLVFSDNEEQDLTEKLNKGFNKAIDQMANLDGYILMKNSPSCGMERVKVYQKNGHPHQQRTAGLFAQALMDKYPLMPIEEEGRLHDTLLFDNFVTRVYAYHNFKSEVLNKPSIHQLIQFHSSYKYLLMAHNQNAYRSLGRLLGTHNGKNEQNIIAEYLSNFMQALAKPANRKNHTNTLLHLLGYLKKVVPSEARQHIVEVIYSYKNGMTPLSTPRTLLMHYFQQYGSQYINSQRYLSPYPENLNPLIKYF